MVLLRETAAQTDTAMLEVFVCLTWHEKTRNIERGNKQLSHLSAFSFTQAREGKLRPLRQPSTAMPKSTAYSAHCHQKHPSHSPESKEASLHSSPMSPTPHLRFFTLCCPSPSPTETSGTQHPWHLNFLVSSRPLRKQPLKLQALERLS